MENEGITSKKNTFILPYGEAQVQISSNFDSGNLNNAAIDLEKQEIQLIFGKDKEIKPSSKTWFYFSIQSNHLIQNLKLYFLRVNTLSTAAKIYDFYRPVLRYEGGEWERHSSAVDFQVNAEGDVNFKMNVKLPKQMKLEIALCYPWSFTENEAYLNNLCNKLRKREDLYFNKEVLIYSPEGRPLHLLAISDSNTRKFPAEKYIEHLFPCKEKEEHYRQVHKPLIIITARVHPGQIGSSYSLIGMIQYLIGKGQQAARLRDQFYFLIVPMLNPDGVFNGNNRMDSLGQNLNRFYHLPDLFQQPSCYAVKSMVQSLKKQIFAFFDLHGHANKKSCFLFGNSISNARRQTQSVLFAKYLSSVCQHVQFKTCNFSKQQMSSRDKNQNLSKQGCARVVVHRWTDSPYCYTLETGLFKSVKVDEKGIVRYGEKFYCPQIYQEVGAKMMMSFYAILQKAKPIQEMRKFCADYVQRLEKIGIKKDKMRIEKQKNPKSMKSVKSEDKESEQLSRKTLGQKQNEQIISISQSMDRVKLVNAVLHRNKEHLLRLEEDDDE